MGRRACKKIIASLEAMFLFGSKVCSGTISSFSRDRMVIHTKLKFPLEWSEQFDVLIFHKDRRITVPVRIRNFVKTGTYYEAINVEVVNAGDEYLDLIECHSEVMNNVKPINHTGKEKPSPGSI